RDPIRRRPGRDRGYVRGDAHLRRSGRPGGPCMSESALERERKAHQGTKDAAQRDRLEFQQKLELESVFRTSQWNELLADFPPLKDLVRALLHVRLAAGTLRGAPTTDTMRVSHTQLTSVEAAADWPKAKHGKRDRSRVRWAN